MKYVIYLLIGIALVSLVAPTVALEKVKTSETNSITATSEEKAETPKEPVKDAKKPETKEAPKPDEKPVDVVKDNPKGCDRATEWIYPDGSCHAKAKEARDSIASSTVKTPSKPSTTGGCELVYNYSNWDTNVAHAVCMAESGGNTNAANYNDNHGKCIGSFGLMQLACFWIPNPTDPYANIAKANEIWSRSGWQPWGAYTSGKYLKYL